MPRSQKGDITCPYCNRAGFSNLVQHLGKSLECQQAAASSAPEQLPPSRTVPRVVEYPQGRASATGSTPEPTGRGRRSVRPRYASRSDLSVVGRQEEARQAQEGDDLSSIGSRAAEMNFASSNHLGSEHPQQGSWWEEQDNEPLCAGMDDDSRKPRAAFSKEDDDEYAEEKWERGWEDDGSKNDIPGDDADSFHREDEDNRDDLWKDDEEDDEDQNATTAVIVVPRAPPPSNNPFFPTLQEGRQGLPLIRNSPFLRVLLVMKLLGTTLIFPTNIPVPLVL